MFYDDINSFVTINTSTSKRFNINHGVRLPNFPFFVVVGIGIGIHWKKAEGLSRFVYPSVSLYVNDSYCKDISNLFYSFI